jgi:hypothetical protein
MVMKMLKIIDPEKAKGKVKSILDSVHDELGLIPNSIRLMANSPAVLEGYRCMDRALGKDGTLPPRLRAHLALFVSELNRCRY